MPSSFAGQACSGPGEPCSLAARITARLCFLVEHPQTPLLTSARLHWGRNACLQQYGSHPLLVWAQDGDGLGDNRSQIRQRLAWCTRPQGCQALGIAWVSGQPCERFLHSRFFSLEKLRYQMLTTSSLAHLCPVEQEALQLDAGDQCIAYSGVARPYPVICLHSSSRESLIWGELAGVTAANLPGKGLRAQPALTLSILALQVSSGEGSRPLDWSNWFIRGLWCMVAELLLFCLNLFGIPLQVNASTQVCSVQSPRQTPGCPGGPHVPLLTASLLSAYGPTDDHAGKA